MVRNISEAIIKRLPRYYRYLTELDKMGVAKVSSSKLADLLGITASQVRQDFCTFGGFGMQGYGYDVKRLVSEIGGILGLDSTYEVIVVGGGNIGTALTKYRGFSSQGFYIRAVFDVELEGKHIPDGIELLHIDNLESYVAAHHIDIAIIATQKEIAYDTAHRLINAGVKAIWNFAPIDLHFDGDVSIENINMSDSLFVLSYRMKNK